MSLIDDPERATRLARAIVSDVGLYNRDAVREGLARDDLFERLDKEIQRARAYWAERVTPRLSRDSAIFEHALVDVLVYRSRGLASRPW